MITKVAVYDPAMCCPSGVCGPSVDPKLAAFAADIDWLQSQGVDAERFSLAQQPQAFVDNSLVTAELHKDAECLPLVLINGEIVARGFYPDRAALAKLCGVTLEEAKAADAGCGCKPGGCC